MSTPAPFEHQVAGHPSSILASPTGGATVIKPSSATELAWYSQVGPKVHPELIGKATPAFFGTLKLEGKLGKEGQLEVTTESDAVPEEGKEMLVLENITFRFKHPNVFDFKLGTQLYDDDASEEKKARMTQAALDTTSVETGVRLTGFQVWNNSTESYDVTDKKYGKSIKPAQLPEGVGKFFAPLIASKSPMLKPLVRSILTRLEEIIVLWKSIEVRMRGGSLLLVVEGDLELLKSALEREGIIGDKGFAGEEHARSRSRFEFAEENQHEEDDAESTDSKGDALPSSLRAFDLRVIDFAHTTSVEGQGPDEGVLKGLQTVKGLLENILLKSF